MLALIKRTVAFHSNKSLCFVAAMKKILLVSSFFFCLPCDICAQSTGDTMYRYSEGSFLLKVPGRYELRDTNGLIEWWENMTDYLTVNNKSYHLVKRKVDGKWKIGLFHRNEGKLLLRPQYEQINNFFESRRLLSIKIDSGFFVYAVENEKRTREGFKSFRQFGNDCLAFTENSLYIYNDKLELRDSMAGPCQPAGKLSNAEREYIFLDCKESKVLLDDQYHRSAHPEWRRIVKLESKLMVVEGEHGQGVYHLGQNRPLTSYDHDPFSYELHEERFSLAKAGYHILYDSNGNILTKVQADGIACVDDLRAFFYRKGGLFKVMNSAGKILKTPDFDDFQQSNAPIGQFIARIKGEKKSNRYAWVYLEKNGQKTITGIKLLGEYKEYEPPIPSWPPNQPVPEKQ